MALKHACILPPLDEPERSINAAEV
eukprot:SAG31_NODE_6014_length_2214_cov_1.825059_1_plen_24_part_10